MKFARTGIFVVALAFVLVACNRSPSETQSQESAPTAPVETATLPPPPAGPPPIPPSTELPIGPVDSVMLSRPQDAPESMIIRVLGTAPSAGWTEPKLEPMADTSGDTSVKSYQFVATSPETAGTGTATQPLETEL